MNQTEKLNRRYSRFFRHSRIERGITQAKAAKSWGIKQNHLSMIETEKIGWHATHIEKASRILGMDPEEFVKEARKFRPPRTKRTLKAA